MLIITAVAMDQAVMVRATKITTRGTMVSLIIRAITIITTTTNNNNKQNFWVNYKAMLKYLYTNTHTKKNYEKILK